jgi:hypothetical protein
VAVIPVCGTKIRGVTHARDSYVGPPKRGEVLVTLIIHASLTCNQRRTNASSGVAFASGALQKTGRVKPRTLRVAKGSP